MWPDRVSNQGPLTYESGAYRLRYAARQVQWNVNSSNTDGSFRTAVSNSFLSPIATDLG